MRTDRWALARTWALRLLGVGTFVALLDAARRIFTAGAGLTFFYDEWEFVLFRRDPSIDSFLRPNSGHLWALPVAVYQVLFRTVGLSHYTAYRLIVVALHLVCVVLVIVYLWPRVGLVAALFAGVLVSYFGAAWQDLLWPFQMGFFGTIAAATIALLMLDRAPTPRRDVATSVLIGVAVGCSGIGVLVLSAVGIELVLRHAWRRLWVAGVPGVLYAWWYLVWGTSQARKENLRAVPAWVRDAGGSVWSWLVGFDGHHVSTLGVALTLLLVVVVAIRRSDLDLPRIAGLLVLTYGFWALTGLTRAQYGDPGTSRYLYPGAVFSLLLAAEVARSATWRPRAIAGAVAAVALMAAWGGNVDQLDIGGVGLRDNSQYVSAQLGAVELAGAALDPSLQPDPVRMPQVTVGPYLAAVAQFGSPSDSVAELRSRQEPMRAEADGVLAAAITVVAPTGPGAQCVTASGVVTTGSEGATLVVTGPAEVRTRVFADAFPTGATLSLPGAEPTAVNLPALGVPWVVDVQGPPTTTVCVAAGSS